MTRVGLPWEMKVAVDKFLGCLCLGESEVKPSEDEKLINQSLLLSGTPSHVEFYTV